MGKASLVIESWHGAHNFIVSDAVARHPIISGRDFLKANDVEISHSDDLVTFNCSRKPLKVPIVQTTGSTHANVCKVSSTTIIAQNSQKLVPFKPSPELNQFSTFIFEPIRSDPNGFMIARSTHSLANELYCNVLNYSESPIRKANQIIGTASAIDVDDIEEELADHSSIPNGNKFDLDRLDINESLAPHQKAQLKAILLKNSQAFTH